MPHFFFNHITENSIIVDDVGTEFSSLEAAYLDTCQAALAIAFEKLRSRQDPTTDSFEIFDDKQNLLMHVPFSEVLRPAATISVSALREKFISAMENCQRQLERNDRLKEDVRAEFSRTRRLFGALRANLSTSYSR
jgi:hypothetical protein